jgi:hypothetical protein
MHISLTSSQVNGFKRWSDAQRPSNDDDSPGGATPSAVTEPPSDDREAVQEPPDRE